MRPLQDSPWRLRIADPDDIAPMKLFALAGRGSRKDFADPYRLLRSLTFFDDAESEAMPDVLQPIRWDAIKSFFRAEAARLFRTLGS